MENRWQQPAHLFQSSKTLEKRFENTKTKTDKNKSINHKTVENDNNQKEIDSFRQLFAPTARIQHIPAGRAINPRGKAIVPHRKAIQPCGFVKFRTEIQKTRRKCHLTGLSPISVWFAALPPVKVPIRIRIVHKNSVKRP